MDYTFPLRFEVIQGEINYGGRSSVGRVLECGSRCRGFEPRRSPHFYIKVRL
jgi:hypothetical protein